jgi:hypothetical protein
VGTVVPPAGGTLTRKRADLSIVATPAESIDGVLERMAAIEAALPRQDGVAYFNRMYRKVTEEVRAANSDERFEDKEFLERLDVVFGNLFFDAVACSIDGRDIPAAWSPLFHHRDKADTYPIQFALAGMNAHINHDLPLAVDTTCRELALLPEDDTPPHRDFLHVNEVLGAVEDRVKVWFEQGVLVELDRDLGQLDDAFAMWSIRSARDLAWDHAKLLWALSDHPRLREAYLSTLTRLVHFGGNGILI